MVTLGLDAGVITSSPPCLRRHRAFVSNMISEAREVSGWGAAQLLGARHTLAHVTSASR